MVDLRTDVDNNAAMSDAADQNLMDTLTSEFNRVDADIAGNKDALESGLATAQNERDALRDDLDIETLRVDDLT